MDATARSLQLSQLDAPLCLCGTRMRLSRIEPHPVLAHTDAVFFECTACNDAVTELRRIDAATAGVAPRLSA